MANGDRTRRKQDDEQPGLFDHIVAADLEGIDPPSMDGVPEVQVHEPTPPPPGQTLAAWGDEDPTLTAPRVVEPTDAWESVEPKAETAIDEPQPIAEVTEAPAVAGVAEDVLVADDAVVEEPTVAEVVADVAAIVEEPTVAEPIAAVEAHVSEPTASPFKRVEPIDTGGRAPVIALHGMPSRRIETTPTGVAAEAIVHRLSAVEPAAASQPLPTHGLWAWLELTRISNVLTVATNAMVGLWVAHLLAGQATIERFIDWMPRHVGIVAGTCLLYLFGMVLNDLLDRAVRGNPLLYRVRSETVLAFAGSERSTSAAPLPRTIDRTDRLIIREVQRDGRISFTDIAQRTGISATSAADRFRRLLGDGTVRILTLPDPPRIDLNLSGLIQFQLTQPLAAVLPKLAAFSELAFLSACTGRVSLLCEFNVRDEAHFDELRGKLLAIHGVDYLGVNILRRIYRQSFEWGAIPAD